MTIIKCAILTSKVLLNVCGSKQSTFSSDTSNIYSTMLKITLKENLIRFCSIFYDELVATNNVLIIYICLLLSKRTKKE